MSDERFSFDLNGDVWDTVRGIVYCDKGSICYLLNLLAEENEQLKKENEKLKEQNRKLYKCALYGKTIGDDGLVRLVGD